MIANNQKYHIIFQKIEKVILVKREKKNRKLINKVDQYSL
jgi:hypothetical protein